MLQNFTASECREAPSKRKLLSMELDGGMNIFIQQEFIVGAQKCRHFIPFNWRWLKFGDKIADIYEYHSCFILYVKIPIRLAVIAKTAITA